MYIMAGSFLNWKKVPEKQLLALMTSCWMMLQVLPSILPLYFIDEFNTQNTLENNQLNFLKKHHNIKDTEILEKKIMTRNLNNILDDHKFYNIDFMNLDIEGHELSVLKTLNFNKFKIKYLCIEMIEHNEDSITKPPNLTMS